MKVNGNAVKPGGQSGGEVEGSLQGELYKVLNSTFSSLRLVREQLKNSEIVTLVKAADLLKEHASDLGGFLSEDPKGKLVGRFIGQLAIQLTREQEILLRECDHLADNIATLKQLAALLPPGGLESAAGNGEQAGELKEACTCSEAMP